MQNLKRRWPQYFNYFVLVSAVYLLIGLASFVLNELAQFFEWGFDIFGHNDRLSFYFVGSISAVTMLASLACIAYISFSGYVKDFRWGWSGIIFIAMFFNFTPFILLLFYYLCLREPKVNAQQI